MNMKREIKDFYQILGLSRTASPDDIRKAYRTYAAKFHPDKHEGDSFFEERFKEIKEAYDLLIDDDRRWKYDMRRFGRSVVVRAADPQKFILDENSGRKRKIRFEAAHIDAYLAAFYFVNLTAWVIIKKLSLKPTASTLIWSVFLCVISSLLFWLFVNGLSERIRKGVYSKVYFPLMSFLLALAIGYVLVWTSWPS